VSYLGYVKLMTAHCKAFANPTILEVGVDRGQTALPLISNLLRLSRGFRYVGVDIRHDPCFSEQISQMEGVKTYLGDNNPDFNVAYTIENSLDILPNLAKADNKFDLILIDGDHNYGTVKQELSYLNDLSHSHTMVVCDDYRGRHENNDNFYKDYESHQGIDTFTDVEIHPSKKGANQAIDEWLDSHKDTWWSYVPPIYEPIFLCGSGIASIKSKHHPRGLSQQDYVITYREPES